ncbi:hypothetical protein BU17DRAFT_70831 [Hysterangium stoloniferum]|nr:hypothetical protein BU17DRAFT_70831 [Hysterangium stoloniferum]
MALHRDHLDHHCLDLLDREGACDAKALSSVVKQQQKDKATRYAKWMVTKATFVGEGFTCKPMKMEQFVRPMALLFKKVNVMHFVNYWREEEPAVADVHTARCHDKRYNHQGQCVGAWDGDYGGKVVFGKYAQIMNNPVNDGGINAVLSRKGTSFWCLRGSH